MHMSSAAILFIVQGAKELASLVLDWETETGMRLFYPVAYDGRRDVWEQSERVMKMTEFAVKETGCKPIVISLGSGSLLVQNAFSRFGKRFASQAHGVLYASPRFQPGAGALRCEALACSCQHMVSRKSEVAFP
jgi:hypothetical protein